MAEKSYFERVKSSNPKGKFRSVGRVKDAHGLKGEVWVVLFAGQADWIEALKGTASFLLGSNEDATDESDFLGESLSFSLKGVRPHKNGLILQSQDIPDRTTAEKLKGKFLFIPESYLEAESGEEYYLSEIEGYRVFEKEKLLGIVAGFSSNVAQDLIVVKLEEDVRSGVQSGSVIEIPFVDAIVIDVDSKEEKLEVDLPLGLIEVQLGLDQEHDLESELDDTAAGENLKK
jgi:16S rRNA processing protein RimM